MTSITIDCAYQEGLQACLDGLGRDECPYPAADPKHDAWIEGWEAARDRVADEEKQDILG